LVEVEENEYESDSQYTTDSDSDNESLNEKDLSDSESEYDSDFDGEDDDDVLDESFLERLAALKEIVPAQQRQAISSTVSNIYSWGNFGLRLAGKLGWVFTSSALLIVFPLALESDREKMMQQWEAEQGNMAQGGQPHPGMAGGMPSGAPGVAPGVAPGLA
ncbi:mitochondrial import receptor subunit Tom22, partial [Linderina macrospora]